MTITQTNTLLRTYVYATKEAFHFTPTKLEAFKAKFEAFASGPKPTCVKLAETSSFLCVEAPGAKTAKTLMDAAGPILAAVSSVQKACSNTAKVTNFASKLMTIAKATCVAAKLACDAGCGAASASVKGLLAELKTIEASVSSDQAQASGQCEMECESRAASQCSATTIGFMACYTPALAACNTPCQADVTKKTADAKAALQKITASISKENVPTPAGSVAATQVQCNMNAKDIVGLALNALSLANARESAKECDRKMASTGTGGGPVTPQQYCEIPANSGTQFCKCQQNSKQEGCPGNTGTGSLVSKDADKSNVAGVNLKTGAGLSGFAGGTRGNPILNGGRGSNGQGSGSGGGTNADGVKLGLGGDTTGGSGAGGGVAGGGAHGGGNSGGGAADSNGGGAPEKKWSFGSFANALGGMFGGGGGGKGGKDSKNGNLNSKQQEAIKRKLASDKLAGEITSASGKSNWEKVHQTYLIKDNSLLTGN